VPFLSAEVDGHKTRKRELKNLKIAKVGNKKIDNDGKKSGRETNPKAKGDS